MNVSQIVKASLQIQTAFPTLSEEKVVKIVETMVFSQSKEFVVWQNHDVVDVASVYTTTGACSINPISLKEDGGIHQSSCSCGMIYPKGQLPTKQVIIPDDPTHIVFDFRQ